MIKEKKTIDENIEPKKQIVKKVQKKKDLLPLPEVSFGYMLQDEFSQHFNSTEEVTDRKNRAKVMSLISDVANKYRANIITLLKEKEQEAQE